jgi:hypothetical protein
VVTAVFARPASDQGTLDIFPEQFHTPDVGVIFITV